MVIIIIIIIIIIKLYSADDNRSLRHRFTDWQHFRIYRTAYVYRICLRNFRPRVFCAP